jgi:hypothetical protein
MHQDFHYMVQTAMLGRWKAKSVGLSRGGDKNEEFVSALGDSQWGVDLNKDPARGMQLHSDSIDFWHSP